MMFGKTSPDLTGNTQLATTGLFVIKMVLLFVSGFHRGVILEFASAKMGHQNITVFIVS